MAHSNYRDAIKLLVDIRPELSMHMRGQLGQRREAVHGLIRRLDVVVAAATPRPATQRAPLGGEGGGGALG